jgi:hypothetical protein
MKTFFWSMKSKFFTQNFLVISDTIFLGGIEMGKIRVLDEFKCHLILLSFKLIQKNIIFCAFEQN